MRKCTHQARRTPALLLAVVSLALGLACSKADRKAGVALQFWHTFNAEESAALRRYLQRETAPRVETTILPFAQAALRFRSGQRMQQCPDLLRIDSTRIARLAEDRAVLPVPDAIWRTWNYLPEAEELVRIGDVLYGIPQSLDGLALIRRRDSPGPWPPASLAELESFAQWDAHKGPGLGLLVDAYWLIAFLRSFGTGLPDKSGRPSGDSPAAITALGYFASLFQRGIAMNLLQERSPARAMAKAFRDGQLRVVYSGPWDLAGLSPGRLEALEVAAFPNHAAPRGGQVLVVPSCARQPELAWRLARDLSAPSVQAAWARELGTVPVTQDGLAQAGPVAGEFYRALQASAPLPRHRYVSQLFDDLTPAVEATVGGDASAAEALAGVQRAWARLYGNPPAQVPMSLDAGAATGEAGGDAHEP